MHISKYNNAQGCQVVPKSGRSERAGQEILGFIRQLLQEPTFES